MKIIKSDTLTVTTCENEHTCCGTQRETVGTHSDWIHNRTRVNEPILDKEPASRSGGSLEYMR